MAQVLPLGYEKHWHSELVSLRAEFKDLIKQHPEVREAVEKVHDVRSDIATLFVWLGALEQYRGECDLEQRSQPCRGRQGEL